MGLVLVSEQRAPRARENEPPRRDASKADVLYFSIPTRLRGKPCRPPPPTTRHAKLLAESLAAQALAGVHPALTKKSAQRNLFEPQPGVSAASRVVCLLSTPNLTCESAGCHAETDGRVLAGGKRDLARGPAFQVPRNSSRLRFEPSDLASVELHPAGTIEGSRVNWRCRRLFSCRGSSRGDGTPRPIRSAWLSRD